jgi:hypothetical protein
MRAADTSPEAHAAQLEAYRRMSVERKLEVACELCELGREQIVQGFLARDPSLSRAEAELEMLRLLLGEESFEASFGSRARRTA